MSPEIRAFLASDIRSIIHIDALLANLKDIRNRCHERAVNHMNAIYSRRERLYDNNTPFGELSSEGPALDAMVDDANTYLSLIRGNLGGFDCESIASRFRVTAMDGCAWNDNSTSRRSGMSPVITQEQPPSLFDTMLDVLRAAFPTLRWRSPPHGPHRRQHARHGDDGGCAMRESAMRLARPLDRDLWDGAGRSCGIRAQRCMSTAWSIPCAST